MIGNNKIDLSNIETDMSLIGSRAGQLLHSKASIIYLPGFGCDFANHENFKMMLTSYDYYAINFPAHGNSLWKSPSELTPEYFANIVVQFIKERNLEKVILIGHGSSAAVAAIVNNLIPEKIVGNIFISPLETSFQKDASQVVDVLIPRLKEQLETLNNLKVFNYHLKAHNSEAWAIENQKKLAYFNKNADALEIILGYLLSDQLKQSVEMLYKSVKAPTMILYGDSDGLVRLDEVLKKAENLVPNGCVCVIPLAGHEPCFDNPKNYFSNVISFIDDVVALHNKKEIDN